MKIKVDAEVLGIKKEECTLVHDETQNGQSSGAGDVALLCFWRL